MDYFERLLPFLVSRQFAHGRTISADIHCVHDFVEIFSGMESVSQGARSFGFQGLSIDKKHGQSHDILTPLGFLTCLSAVMHIKRHGFLFLAPPCSTWVWMSHGSTGRRRNNAMGDPHNNYVKSQNRLVSRLCHIIWLARKRGVFVIIEQPQDSCMEQHPRLAHLLKRFRMGTFKLDMGAYGAFSQKPTKLWGTAPWLHKMTKKLTGWERQVVRDNGVSSGVTRSWIDTNGKRRCKGWKISKQHKVIQLVLGKLTHCSFHNLLRWVLTMARIVILIMMLLLSQTTTVTWTCSTISSKTIVIVGPVMSRKTRCPTEWIRHVYEKTNHICTCL